MAVPIVVTTAPPTVSVPPPATCVANGGSVYFSKSQNDPIVVADAGEVGNNADSLTLTVSNGTLSTLNTANLIVTGLGTNSITASGTPANLNVALNDLTYSPNGGFFGPTDTLTVKITDPVDNLSASKSVTIYITKWTTLTASSSSSEQPLSPLGLSTSLLLPNGDLMVLGSGPNGGPTNTWYEITPVNGSYANGTWTQLASMNQSRLYFSSDVLPNGDVFVFGGELPVARYGRRGNYATPRQWHPATYSPSAEIVTPLRDDTPSGIRLSPTPLVSERTTPMETIKPWPWEVTNRARRCRIGDVLVGEL